MANGALDPDDFVLRSGPRSGHKREFAFAVRSQSQFDLVGLTRSGKKRLRPSLDGLGRAGVVERSVVVGGGDAGLVDRVARVSFEERQGALPVMCDNVIEKVDSKEDMLYVEASDVRVGDQSASICPLDDEKDVAKADQLMMDIVASPEKAVALNSDLDDASVPVEVPVKLNGTGGISHKSKPQNIIVSVVGNGVLLEAEVVIHPTDVSMKKKRLKKSPCTPVAFRRFTRSMLKGRSSAAETTNPVAETIVVAGDRGNEVQTRESNDSLRKEGLADMVKVVSLPKFSLEDTEMVGDPEEVNTDQFAVTEENCGLQVADENVVPQGALFKSLVPETAPSDLTKTEMEAQSLEVVNKKHAREECENVGESNDVMEVDQVLEATTDNLVSACTRSAVVLGRIECNNDRLMETTSISTSARRFTRSMLKENPKVTEESSSESTDFPMNEGVVERADTKITELLDAKADVNIGQLSKASQISWSALMKKLELKMSKKIAISKCPTNAEELLSTGLLEGLSVRLGKRGLFGTVRDFGILCPCNFCKGIKVVTPCQFQKHAGGSKKDPSDSIYLDNGKSVGDVIRACCSVPVDMLETTIQHAIPSFANSKESCISSQSGGNMSIMSIKLEGKLYKRSLAGEIDSKTWSSPKPILTPNSVNSASKQSSQKKISLGRVTKKDLGLHKLVFSEDALPDGTEVAYYNRGRKLLEGYKQGNGIFCRCCNTEVSPSQFEAHAGWASRRKPYLNIYTSNGVSLHELSLSLSKGRKHSSNDNDDLCSICFDGGDLLLCDLCPRAFHKDCVGLACVPRGKWYCKYCQSMMQREKFVEKNVNAIAAGRVLGVDSIEQITRRCIRIVEVKPPVADASCCILCRQHVFSKKFGPRAVILCDQCEKEYHVGCLKDHNMGDLKELPKGNWFCCGECSFIYDSLQKIILDGPEKLSSSLCRNIKPKGDNSFGADADCDVRWRLLSGKNATFSDNRSILSKAVAIFHECFDPIVDSLTGRDLIPSMVYGRTARDQDFRGMYCAVLTVNSQVVSAGILRILGQNAAELPLVATSPENQGQGYFQTLFSCIEKLLVSLNVKHLMLPAADEVESIWKNKFGFLKVNQDEVLEYAKDSPVTTFQGTSMLHKLVPKCKVEGS